MSSFARSLPAALAALPIAIAVAVSPAPAQDRLLDGPAPSGVAPPSSDRVVRSALPPASKGLDAEFEALAAAKTPAEAHGPEQRILRGLSASGSDTIDLYMAWADKAIGKKDFAAALDMLDQVIVLRPDYAEGFNRRATVYYLTDDYTKAVADIRETLKREPRHFGALTGLAAILKEIGEPERAMEILETVRTIHPTLETAKTQLDKLLEEKAGREI